MATDNYEIAKRDAARQFCDCDQPAIVQRFGLEADDEWIYLTFMGRPCRVSRTTGLLFSKEEEAWVEQGFNAAMTVYDLLGYSKPYAHPSGEIVNTKSLHMQLAVTSPSASEFYPRQKALFDEKVGLLPAAFQRMGATLIDGGDASCEIDVFQGLRMRVQFWEHDDEFDASLDLFWDANVLQYMHYETVWYANAHVVSLIEEALAELS